MKKIKILLAAALIGVCTFGFMGCGDSSNQDNGYAGDTAESEELYEEEEPDDPYVDGMTLEEAREWAQTECSVFVLKDGLYYPLIPGFVAEGEVGSSTTDDVYCGGLVCVTDEYSDYELPVLTKDAKLVEVMKENEALCCTRLSGESGWTIPYSFYCDRSDVGMDSAQFGQKAYPWDEYSDVPEGAEVRSINGEAIDNRRIEAILEKIDEKYEENFWDTEDAKDLVNTTDWESLYADLKMKPVYYGHLSSSGVTAILDTTKGTEVEVDYRYENSVNTETTSAVANYKYYNLPTNITEPKEALRYSNKYTQTEDGYSIIKTGEFESGTYAYGESYLFEVQ